MTVTAPVRCMAHVCSRVEVRPAAACLSNVPLPQLSLGKSTKLKSREISEEILGAPMRSTSAYVDTFSEL